MESAYKTAKRIYATKGRSNQDLLLAAVPDEIRPAVRTLLNKMVDQKKFMSHPSMRHMR